MVGISKKLVMFKNQNYADLKKQHQDLGTLFVDATFPAIDAIIGTTRIPPNIEWKRPTELCDNPKLFIDVESPNIIRAGEYSCNWVVSAFAILAGVNELRNKVIPNYWDQEWGNEPYCGIFHFRLWRFGQWNDVVVDDLLPSLNNTILTTQSGNKNEFWVSLVEKAYAKLHGSYEALREGELADALVDFTGGVCETVDLRAGQYSEIEEHRSQLFDIIRKEMSEHSLICFTLNAPVLANIGERTELGIRKGHAYHVTDIKKVYLGETTLRTLFNGREKVAMIRLRDPREEDIKPGSPDSVLSGEGNPFLYSTDALSRLRSQNTDWQQVKDTEFKRLGLSFRDSTEFWMPMEDVVNEFGEVTICRLVAENLFVVPGNKWRGSSMHGRWQAGPTNSQLDRSGGGDIHSETFLKNPQYLIDINGNVEIMIQLLQYLDLDGLDTPNSNINLLIGFHVIKVENNRVTRLHKLWPHCAVIVVEGHKRKREIMYRGTLSGGRYVLIPTCYRQGDHSSFLLRVFSKAALPNIKELKEDIPKSRIPCSCIIPEIEWVTVVIMDCAVIEHKSQTWTSSRLNLYCAITSEGTTVKTDVSKEESNPVWNCSFIFYRKKPNKPIIIKIFNKNTLFPDELIGECEIPAAVTHGPTPLDASLFPKTKTNENSENPSIGTIHLCVLTEDNLMAV